MLCAPAYEQRNEQLQLTQLEERSEQNPQRAIARPIRTANAK